MVWFTLGRAYLGPEARGPHAPAPRSSELLPGCVWSSFHQATTGVPSPGPGGDSLAGYVPARGNGVWPCEASVHRPVLTALRRAGWSKGAGEKEQDFTENPCPRPCGRGQGQSPWA